MYIRTKDGIVMVNRERKDYRFNDKVGFYYTSYTGINYYDIETKENLEELCDEFLVEFIKDGYKYVWNERYNSTMEELKKNANKVCNIYGAIWTSKGLIYVAKMNDKGALELI